MANVIVTWEGFVIKIFLNFAAGDADLVHDTLWLCLHLGGHEPYMRGHLAEPFEASLRSLLHGCDAIIYALTPASLADPWCRWVYHEAAAQGKPVAPMVLMPCAVPPEFEGDALLDFTDITQSAMPMTLNPMPAFDALNPEVGMISLPRLPLTTVPSAMATVAHSFKSSPGGMMLAAARIDPDGSGPLGPAMRRWYYPMQMQNGYAEEMVHLWWGVAEMNAGQFNEACQHFDRVLAIKPDDLEALNNRCNVLIALGQLPQARADLERLAVLLPSDLAVKEQLTRLLGM